ncbi:MAG: hypothetical protein JW751_18930 [Polyangiaceae bacterium]|nr:hypothetical protein [Polyangiaceae bacterium]
MLPLPVQFIMAMVAHAINARMALKLEYLTEEVRVLREVYVEATGRKRRPTRRGFAGVSIGGARVAAQLARRERGCGSLSEAPVGWGV